jgi:cytochrome c oxidase cbb3-type subunit 1
MSKISNTPSSVNPYSTGDVATRARLSAIDRSMKWPALFFLVSAVMWLLAGTVFALLTAIKMTNPSFFGDIEWLTFGRVRSAHLNAMIYGWAFNAGFAVALWIMARLCRSEVRHSGLLLVAGAFWNLSVTAGIAGILAGGMTSVEWLEMPVYVMPLLVFSYSVIGVWGVIAFRFRQSGHIYVSQWYILAALFWFPWLYTIAGVMIFFEPARGTVQAVTNWWYASNLIGLWFTPIGLAAAYYLIPKVIGRPIYSYYLSMLGFWTLALFYSWSGINHLIGGPLPAWVITIGIVASLMMVMPVVVTAVNLHMTVVGRFRQVFASPTLLFVVFGSISYTLVSFIGSTMALRSVNEVTHFTHFTVGHAHHGVYAFYTMVMFGAIYFIVPRLVYREWPSSALIKCHFYMTAGGITIMILALYIGGWRQGLSLNNADIDFIEIVKSTIPWLHARSVSGLLIAIGHVAFAINFFWMVVARHGREDIEGAPTLLNADAIGEEGAR